MPGPAGEQTGAHDENIHRENQMARDTGPGADEAIRQAGNDDIQRGREPDRREERSEPKVVNSKYQSKRERMQAEFRELRAEQQANPDMADEIAESRRKRFSENVEQPQLKQQPADDDAGQRPQPGAKRKLKVNGKEIELTEEEIIAKAQLALASDDILEGAKRDRDLARQVLETAQSAMKPAGTPAAGEQQPAKPAEAPKAATKLPDAELRKVIEQVQFGNSDEAAEALNRFGEDIVERTVTRMRSELDTNLPGQVRNINDAETRSARTRDALRAISDENPDLTKSPLRQAAFAAATADVMRENMLKIGVQADKLDQLIRDSDAPPAEVMAYAYRQLAEKGHNLPAHDEVVKGAVEKMYDDGMLARPQRGQQQQPQRRDAPNNENRYDPQQRLDRKREIAPQPRRAGAPPSSETPTLSREDRQLAAVRQMRVARGGRR